MDANNNEIGLSNTHKEKERLVNKEKERLVKRAKIVALREEGYSVRQISDQIGCSKSTVQLWLQRDEEEGNLNSKKRTGRPRITTPEEDASILNRAIANPMNTAVQIARAEGLTNRVSFHTVRNRLREGGLYHHIPATRETLKQEHIQERLLFCREHRNHGYEDYWKYVIFVDEKTFKSDCNGRLHCWRPRNTRYQKKHVNETNHSGYVSVNMFGWIWSGGPGELTRITSRFNAEEYVDILQTNVLEAVRTIALPATEHREILLVQDNCRVHTANIVKQWFRENPDIKPLRWPARSPDLNPIENVWGWIVNEWDHANERTPGALEAHVNEMWNTVRHQHEFFENLAKSMPRRIQDCLDAEGSYNKY